MALLADIYSSWESYFSLPTTAEQHFFKLLHSVYNLTFVGMLINASLMPHADTVPA